MPKRLRDESDEEVPRSRSPKRRSRTGLTQDCLSILSDEILLRVFSFVPVSTLVRCQRTSRRLNTIAGDAQLWKALYYNRFVRPRAARLPGIRDAESSLLFFSSRLSKWLDDEGLVLKRNETDWKRQYKLRHNWSRGSCAVSEMEVAERAPVPPLLVCLHEGTIFTVDSYAGLRAWTFKRERKLLAERTLDNSLSSKPSAPPTSLAVNQSDKQNGKCQVAAGFEDGRFSVFELDVEAKTFNHLYGHANSSNGMISSLAYASPYLLTMTATQLLSCYRFPEDVDKGQLEKVLEPPRLLSSLRSHTVWPPSYLSVRLSSKDLVVSIAYALPTYLSGWSVGLQEVRLSHEGDIISSRLTSAVNHSFQPLSPTSQPSLNWSRPGGLPPAFHAQVQHALSHGAFSKPTSLSYSHPYLLVSHSDNTLMLYLVTSTTEDLSISAGNRLWGHTSSVSGAHVGDRGKAVSVTSKGEELRVWELEGGLPSLMSKKRLAAGNLSIAVRPERRKQDFAAVPSGVVPQRRSDDEVAIEQRTGDFSVTRGWVGFDDENVVVLREKGCGSQALVVYDFT